ncbi:MAG: EboA domain-containing protein [Kofleriaceae bacterium]
MATVELIYELVDAVARVAPPEGVEWLTAQLVFDRATFPVAFASAHRRLGKSPIAASLSIPWSTTAGADEYGRAALVLAAIGSIPPEDHVAFIRDLIRRGEVRERQAVLRVLAGLPEPQRFVEIAVDACRTNVQSVFEAIACDNAFPARHFDDPAFAQMVIKSLFVGAPLGRIIELQARTTAELVRMTDAYVSERRAAGRPIPDDVRLLRSTP